MIIYDWFEILIFVHLSSIVHLESILSGSLRNISSKIMRSTTSSTSHLESFLFCLVCSDSK